MILENGDIIEGMFVQSNHEVIKLGRGRKIISSKRKVVELEAYELDELVIKSEPRPPMINNQLTFKVEHYFDGNVVFRGRQIMLEDFYFEQNKNESEYACYVGEIHYPDDRVDTGVFYFESLKPYGPIKAVSLNHLSFLQHFGLDQQKPISQTEFDYFMALINICFRSNFLNLISIQLLFSLPAFLFKNEHPGDKQIVENGLELYYGQVSEEGERHGDGTLLLSYFSTYMEGMFKDGQ